MRQRYLNSLFSVLAFLLFLPLAAHAERTHQIGFGVRNFTFIHDDEYFHIPNASGITLLADVLNPFFEYHFDHYADFEFGAIMQRSYGSNFFDKELDPTAPWIRLTTHPWKPVRVVMGNLIYPHDFYSPIVWNMTQLVKEISGTQFANGRLRETGIQIIFDDHGQSGFPRNDFYYRYDKQDTPTMPMEIMAFGDVMQYRRGPFHADYQADWIHHGGEQTSGGVVPSRTISNINDTVQMLGGGLDYTHLGFSANYFVNHHSIQYENGDLSSFNGNASLSEVYSVWGPVRLALFYWYSNQYFHEDMDPVYGRANLFGHSVRFSSMWIDQIRIWLEYVGYTFQGAGSGGSKYLPVESSISMNVSWEFHIPILEWKTQDGPPINAGPDFRRQPGESTGATRVFDDYSPKY